jgi:hypothetical protein
VVVVLVVVIVVDSVVYSTVLSSLLDSLIISELDEVFCEELVDVSHPYNPILVIMDKTNATIRFFIIRPPLKYCTISINILYHLLLYLSIDYQ